MTDKLNSLAEDRSVPLCVDLDGSLIHSDLLLESFLQLLKRNPLYLLLLPLWLWRGKAVLKAEIARRVEINASTLPYTEGFLAWLKQERQRGRALWLCTASDRKLADGVAGYLGIFDGVVASDGRRNVSGTQKAKELVERFGERGFDYCGNHRVDLKVWRHARSSIVVNGSPSLSGRAASCAPLVAEFAAPQGQFRQILKALRVHQWAKNALVIVPVAAAHRLSEVDVLGASLIAFLAFSLCASSVYLLNDMLDLEADRQHPRKCKRPFASGQLSLVHGLVGAPLLLLGAFTVAAACLPGAFLLLLVTYYGVTVAYSFGLKRLVMIDVLTLAGLYTIRIVAGAAATGIELSFWLLLFAIFVFLSLAIVKRYAELRTAREAGKLSASGRGYQVDDLNLLQSLGAASGYISVLVLALYVNSPDIADLYHHPKAVWALCPIMLYWISRVWLKTYRGRMNDDPLVFALRDPVSVLTGLAGAVVLWLAL